MADGGIPFHETGQQQTFGVSQDCLYNDHTICHSSRCGCSCHRQARVEADRAGVSVARASQVSTGHVEGLDKYCPICRVKAAGEQNYCKRDGAKLSSLRCPECQTPGDAEDVFCGYCGCPMKGDDRELEAAATGSQIADTPVGSPGDAEAAMRAAMRSAKQEAMSKPITLPSKISVGMFK